MPERQTGSWTVSKCTWRCFYQSAIKSPTLSLTFHQNEISWLFYDFSICFVSLYIIFVKAEFFHVNWSFQKEKTLRKRCVYNHGDMYLFCFTYTYMQIPLHSADFAGDVTFDFPDACLFGHPIYFDYQDFLSFASDFSFQHFHEGKLWELNAVTE